MLHIRCEYLWTDDAIRGKLDVFPAGQAVRLRRPHFHVGAATFLCHRFDSLQDSAARMQWPRAAIVDVRLTFNSANRSCFVLESGVGCMKRRLSGDWPPTTLDEGSMPRASTCTSDIHVPLSPTTSRVDRGPGRGRSPRCSWRKGLRTEHLFEIITLAQRT
jgi:hypothetical protein